MHWLADSLMLNPILVAKAMMDGKEGKSLMEDDIARTFIMKFVNEREISKSRKTGCNEQRIIQRLYCPE